MKIYFAGSIRGGRDDQELYFRIIELLSKYGQVLTEHVGDAKVFSREQQLSSREIFERDVAWLQEADVVVAEVTTPSLGVGYELGLAESWGKSVLCVYRKSNGRDLSAMIAGNAALQVAEYTDTEDLSDLQHVVQNFMNQDMLS